MRPHYCLFHQEQPVVSHKMPETMLILVLYEEYDFFEKFFHQLEMVAFITTLLPHVLYYNIG